MNNDYLGMVEKYYEIFEKIATLGLSSLTKEELELIEKSTD